MAQEVRVTAFYLGRPDSNPRTDLASLVIEQCILLLLSCFLSPFTFVNISIVIIYQYTKKRKINPGRGLERFIIKKRIK